MGDRPPSTSVPAGSLTTKLVIQRSTPLARTEPWDYREDLRQDFWFACAYCTIAESEARGVGFEIEHFVPETLDPTLRATFLNLLWACQQCNNRKGDIFPTREQQERGLRFIRPDHDDPRDHIELDGTRVRPTTEPGRFTVDVVGLNRQSLRRLREIRRRIAQADDQIILGLRYLGQFPIDALSTRSKILVSTWRKRLGNRSDHARERLDSILKEANRSEFVDPDPERAKQLAARRQYLAEHGVLSTRTKRRARQGRATDKK